MSEYRVDIDKPVSVGTDEGHWFFRLSREQAQQLSDSLASQGVGVSLGVPDNRPPMDRPAPGRPIAVQCPRCGGRRVKLEWFAGDQVYITQCLDCEERKGEGPHCLCCAYRRECNHAGTPTPGCLIKARSRQEAMAKEQRQAPNGGSDVCEGCKNPVCTEAIGVRYAVVRDCDGHIADCWGRT